MTSASLVWGHYGREFVRKRGGRAEKRLPLYTIKIKKI
jgi:hypothetical protein